jgi:hypothetical protein
MTWFDQRRVQDAILFHALFFAVAIPVALGNSGKQLGMAASALALGYNIALPLVGHWRKHGDWVRLWAFLLPMSITLPCADWMLLWQVCWFAGAVRKPYLFAAVFSLLAFLVWEWAARPMALWHAVGVRQVAGFAMYPLIPEMLLGLAALWMWRGQQYKAWPQRLAASVSVSVFYAGALSLALLWIG